jgi:hypothetical protein
MIEADREQDLIVEADPTVVHQLEELGLMNILRDSHNWRAVKPKTSPNNGNSQEKRVAEPGGVKGFNLTVFGGFMRVPGWGGLAGPLEPDSYHHLKHQSTLGKGAAVRLMSGGKGFSRFVIQPPWLSENGRGLDIRLLTRTALDTLQRNVTGESESSIESRLRLLEVLAPIFRKAVVRVYENNGKQKA